MLADIHGSSTLSQNSVIQAESQGPAPEIISALSNYLFSIVELTSISSATVKSMISGDLTHRRLLHQSDMIEVKPLSFAIAASNSIPNIHQADEAIRDRLAPFLFKNVFVDEVELVGLIDDNTLLAMVCNYMISSTKFQSGALAKEFSNLLFEHFQSVKDENGLLQVTISKKNETSQALIGRILAKNNIIYNILYLSGIVFDENLHVKYEDLRECLLPEIEKYNETTKRKQFTWNVYLHELSLLFKHKEFADKSGISGMGIPKNQDVDDSSYNFNIIFKKSDSFISCNDIQSHLFYVKGLQFHTIKSIIEKLKHRFSIWFDANRNGFREHSLLVD